MCSVMVVAVGIALYEARNETLGGGGAIGTPPQGPRTLSNVWMWVAFGPNHIAKHHDRRQSHVCQWVG